MVVVAVTVHIFSYTKMSLFYRGCVNDNLVGYETPNWKSHFFRTLRALLHCILASNKTP